MPKIVLAVMPYQEQSIAWRGVRMPRSVPLFPDHLPLSASFRDADKHAHKNKLGTAWRIRHAKNKTVYWTRQRGNWSADARRVGKHLQLVGFADVPIPGFPRKTR